MYRSATERLNSKMASNWSKLMKDFFSSKKIIAQTLTQKDFLHDMLTFFFFLLFFKCHTRLFEILIFNPHPYNAPLTDMHLVIQRSRKKSCIISIQRPKQSWSKVIAFL